MTAAIFWRFVWKEYRVMRAFWISMACLAVLAQLALVAFPGLTHYSTVWTFSFALIFPALYAVACGATMFAAEKEEGTYEFLRGLPVTAWRILTGKLAFAVASTLLLIAALWCLAAGLSRGSSVDAQLRPQLWGTYGLAAVEGLAWGMLFSLVLRRPLQAAVLAIVAASVAVHVALWRSMPFAGEGHVFELGQYLAVVPYRSMIAGAVLLVDGLLVRRWLRPDKRTARRSLAWWRRRVRTGVSAAAPAMPLSPRRSVILGRLVWQTWRQSRWTMAAMAGPGTLGAIFAIVEISAFSPSLLRNDVSFFAAIAVAASLMGACVFLSDNERRSVRFLADHGVRPRQVWFARELTWMAGLAAWAIVWRAIIGFLSNGNSTGHFGELIAIAIAGFACGQFASMLVPSGIVAAFVGVVLALVCAAWVGLIQLCGINWLWSVFPIPLVLLFATWLRAPDWLLERNTWRGWLRVGTAVAVPISALLIAVPLYRIYQIPEVSPGFAPEEYSQSIKPTKAAEETAEMFIRATYLLDHPRQNGDGENRARPPDAGDLAYLRANGDALALALQAAQRPECSFYGVKDPKFWENSGPLTHLLDVSARQLESEGKLADAWTRWMATLQFESRLQNSPWSYYQLPFWAAEPGQTRERIVAAIKQLEQFETTLRPPADALKDRYLIVNPLVTGGPDAVAGRGGPDATRLLLCSMLPWERQRAARLLNLMTADDLSELTYLMSGIAEGRPVIRLLRYSRPPPSSEYEQWLKTTVLLRSFYGPSSDGEHLGRSFAMEVNMHRATRLVMALEAWKTDHDGTLPERLNQLVGTYLDKLPLDPYTSRDFVYSRTGIALPDSFLQNSPRQLPKPFIWSTGENVRPVYPASNEVRIREWTRNPFDEIEIKEGGWRKAKDEFDVWISGWRIEIP